MQQEKGAFASNGGLLNTNIMMPEEGIPLLNQGETRRSALPGTFNIRRKRRSSLPQSFWPLSNDAYKCMNENNKLKKEVSVLKDNLLKLSNDNKNLSKNIKRLSFENEELKLRDHLRQKTRNELLFMRGYENKLKYINDMRDQNKDIGIGSWTEEQLMAPGWREGYVDGNSRKFARNVKKQSEVLKRGDTFNPTVNTIKSNSQLGGTKKKKRIKTKKSKKSKKTQKAKRSKGGVLKISCKSECNKTKKILPLIMKKLGLSKKEIEQKMREHDEKCEGNCIKLMNDKDFIKKLMKEN